MTANNENTDNQGDIDFRLSENKKLGICILVTPISLVPQLSPMTKIVSVDGKPIKGLSLGRVQQMCRGPIGSQVSLQVLGSQQKIISIVFERQPISSKKQTRDPLDVLKVAAGLLDDYDESAQPANFQDAVSSCEDAGLELFASALTRTALSLSDNWFDKNSMTAIVTNVRAAIYLDGVGRIAEADDAVERALSAVKRRQRVSVFDQRFLLGFAEHLSMTGRLAAASEVHEHLLTCAKSGDGPPGRELVVFRAEASVLAAAGKKRETESLCDQIVSLSQKRKSSPDMELAADLYASDGHFEKAISTYQTFIEAAETEWFESQRSGDRDRPLVHALYKLACVQDQASETSAAVQSLHRALALYTKRLDEEEQVETERIPVFFPTVSDTEIKLAELQLKTGDTDSSVKHLRSAIARIEKALGENSPYLRDPLLQLGKAFQSLGDSEKAKQARERATGLPTGGDAGDSKKSDYPVIASAFRSIQAKDYKSADELIERLIAMLENTGNSEELQKRQTRILNCLTSFLRLFINDGRFDYSRTLSDRIIAAGCSRPMYPLALSGVLTDRAIFARELGLSEEECWYRLESSLLAHIDEVEASSNVLNEPKSVLTISVGEMLRRLSLAFFYAGDYARASAILQRVMLSASIESPTEQSFPGLELARLTLVGRVLNDMRSSMPDHAAEVISSILSDSHSISAVIGKKLIQIAMVYCQNGLSADAKRLLQNVIQKGVPNDAFVSTIQAQYRWKLGKILARDGRADQASELIFEARQLYGNSPQPLGFAIFSAELCSELNRHAEASRNYLLAANSISKFAFYDPALLDLKTQLLRRAQECAEKTPDLTNDERVSIMQGLGESIGISNLKESSDNYRNAMELLPSESKKKADLALRVAVSLVGQNEQWTKVIESHEKAAALAEKTDIAAAVLTWLVLASAEVNAGQSEKAVEHASHAIELFKKYGKRKQGFRPLIIFTDNSIAGVLHKQGHSAQAERLLKDSADATKAVYGVDHSNYSVSLAELARFYAGCVNYKEFFPLVDKILAIYSAHEGLIPPDWNSHRHEALRILNEATVLIGGKGQFEKAIDIQTEILRLQEKKLPKNSLQFIDTLIALATLYKTNGDFEKAEPLYRKSLEIGQLFYVDGNMAMFYRSEYADVLRKLGRKTEADRLMLIHARNYGDREQFRRQILEMEREATKPMTMREPQKGRDLLLQALALAEKDEPYGALTVKVIESLGEHYFKQKDFAAAEPIYKQLIEMFDAGASGSMQQQRKCFIKLARIYINQSKFNLAIEAIVRAKKVDPSMDTDEPSYYSLREFAELGIEVGHTDEASKYLDQAENSVRKESQISPSTKIVWLSGIASLWKKLGNEDRANALLEIVLGLKAEEEASGRRSPIPSRRPPTSADPIFGPYMADLERRIKRAWFPTDDVKQTLVRVIFCIDGSGKLSEVNVSLSSELPAADNAALKAIEHAAPFRPLPAGARRTEKFEFTFDFRAINRPGYTAVRKL
jgi:TonB family protein